MANLMKFELPGSSRTSGLRREFSASSFGIVDQAVTECMILPQNRKKQLVPQAESGGKIFSRINSNLAQDPCAGCSMRKSMKKEDHVVEQKASQGSRQHDMQFEQHNIRVSQEVCAIID